MFSTAIAESVYHQVITSVGIGKASRLIALTVEAIGSVRPPCNRMLESGAVIRMNAT
jgi:hypothetical protein